jgi:hypothetical protein
MQAVPRLYALALFKVGSNSAAKIAMMAITTRSSIKVNAIRLWFGEDFKRVGYVLPNDPKLSHGHRRPSSECNNDIQSSSLNPKLKAQWPLAPARC